MMKTFAFAAAALALVSSSAFALEAKSVPPIAPSGVVDVYSMPPEMIKRCKPVIKACYDKYGYGQAYANCCRKHNCPTRITY